VYRTLAAIGQPIREIDNRLVGRWPGRSDSKEQYGAAIVDAACRHVFAEQVRDVIPGAEDVGHDELEGNGFTDGAYRFRDVDRSVESLGKEQRNDNGAVVTSIGELTYRSGEVRLGQVKISGQSDQLCLLGDGNHQPLDAEAALGMPAAVGESDQRTIWLAQLRQRVSRCGV
jgi:hypothetical protein